MPVVNLREDTGGPMDWFNALPKLSKFYAASIVATGACISYKIPMVYSLVLDWFRHVKENSAVQVWRLFTHVFLAAPLSFRLLMNVIWILTYGSTLESSTYSIHPEDYLFLFFFGTVAFTLISLIMGPLLGLGFITVSGSSMIMMLLYVWSKEFPHQDIKLYGIIKIKGFWLPFAFLVLGMFLGGDVMADILGILVGHAWYFYTTLLPRGTGKQYLPTPWFIRWAAQKMQLGAARPAVTMTAPPGQRPQGPAAPGGGSGQGGFRAFGGPARRLGSS